MLCGIIEGDNMINAIAAVLLHIDAWLITRIIPVTHFGHELIAVHYDGFGVPNREWRVHWPDREAQPFYAHNRRLYAWANALRSLATTIAQSPRAK